MFYLLVSTTPSIVGTFIGKPCYKKPLWVTLPVFRPYYAPQTAFVSEMAIYQQLGNGPAINALMRQLARNEIGHVYLRYRYFLHDHGSPPSSAAPAQISILATGLFALT
jgi:hypothetical protein